MEPLWKLLQRDMPKQSAPPIKEFPKAPGTTRVTFHRELLPPQGKAGYVDFPNTMTKPEMLKQAYASFNHVGQHKATFQGPSASVGDVFVLDRDGVNREAYRVQQSSFKKEPMQPKWDGPRFERRPHQHR